MRKKRILVMITEGPTDYEFYEKALDYTKAKTHCLKYNFDDIKKMCANGIGNMHKQMLAKFKREICGNPSLKDCEKVVCFCYDADVFRQTKQNPPIDRAKMKEDFKKAGANKIVEIVADDMIEDFLLYDIDGIKRFLKLRKNYRLPKKQSLELLQRMFKDANRIYTKGAKTAGLIASLDMGVIMPNICNQFCVLCNELGYDCNGSACSQG